MGSNTEKKPWTNLQSYTKIEAKGLRATTLLSQSWKSDIGTYPISHIKHNQFNLFSLPKAFNNPIKVYLISIILSLLKAI